MMVAVVLAVAVLLVRSAPKSAIAKKRLVCRIARASPAVMMVAAETVGTVLRRRIAAVISNVCLESAYRTVSPRSVAVMVAVLPVDSVIPAASVMVAVSASRLPVCLTVMVSPAAAMVVAGAAGSALRMRAAYKVAVPWSAPPPATTRAAAMMVAVARVAAALRASFAPRLVSVWRNARRAVTGSSVVPTVAAEAVALARTVRSVLMFISAPPSLAVGMSPRREAARVRS